MCVCWHSVVMRVLVSSNWQLAAFPYAPPFILECKATMIMIPSLSTAFFSGNKFTGGPGLPMPRGGVFYFFFCATCRRRACLFVQFSFFISPSQPLPLSIRASFVRCERVDQKEAIS